MFICYSQASGDFSFGHSLNEAFRNLQEISDCEIEAHEVQFFREIEVEVDVQYTFAEIE